MAKTSAASGPLEEPAGMEQEAQLLTSLQEIPNISKCWLRPAQGDGLSLSVCGHTALPDHTFPNNQAAANRLRHCLYAWACTMYTGHGSS